MKRFFPILLVVLLIVGILLVEAVSLFSLLFAPQDAILNSLPDYESKEYYTCGGFQDYTDYAKYTYHVYETVFIENPYFTRVVSEDMDKILSYIENFEGWVEICEDFPSDNYDFDKSILTEGDYYCILSAYEESGREFWDYDVYYFDLDTQVLYYFHNNI